MSVHENGLIITITPPNAEELTADRYGKTKVTIKNQKHELGTRLEVSLDLPLELKAWCQNNSYRITIGYQKSQEVKFIWNVPDGVNPGIYNYNLRIRFLRSTSFYSFQPKPLQLKILKKINNSAPFIVEPRFTIIPASSSTKHIILSSKETLNLEINVHNRSNKIDNYRIGTDLEDSWFTIVYPETIKRTGAIDGNEALNLNPDREGKVYLTIRPPADAIAGIYKPEITLYSLNSPELFLKKIVYLDIKPRYILQAELKTILNKVSYKKARYQLILTNQGNTIRAIDIKARSSDEEEWGDYLLESSSVNIPPNKTIEIKLDLEPNSKQKRPLLATKQFNFQVDLTDKNERPLPENLPLKGSLFWRSRPLWHLLLLLVLALGILSGCAWIIWQILFPKTSESLIILEPEKAAYPYGTNIAINWAAENYENIDRIVIFDKERERDKINTKCYYFDDRVTYKNCTLINSRNLPNNCDINDNFVRCSRVIFRHAKDIKSYNFRVQAFDETGKVIEDKELEEPISILPKPTLEVFDSLRISPVRSKYSPNDSLKLIFEVSNIEKHFTGEDRIFLSINGERQPAPIISQQNIGEFCSRSNSDRYLCSFIITFPEDGKYSLGIELNFDSFGRIDNQQMRYEISEPIVIQTPINLIYFKINNSNSGTLEEEVGTPITVSWFVEGNNAKVNIDCLGGQLGLRGSRQLNVPEGETQYCTLEILDEEGRAIDRRTLGVIIKERPQPEETEPSTTTIENILGN